MSTVTSIYKRCLYSCKWRTVRLVLMTETVDHSDVCLCGLSVTGTRVISYLPIGTSTSCNLEIDRASMSVVLTIDSIVSKVCPASYGMSTDHSEDLF